jgi:osmoprotectant transport system ATP-binding protein
MIDLQDVHKRFGTVRAVDGVSLRIAPGSITALIGASGSGKSTLLRLINRMVDCDRGRILLDGHDIRSGPPEALRRRMGYVIQSTGLFPHWTVARNIATVPVLLGWPAAQVASRVDELLALLGLDPAQFRDRWPHQLSGGQQQRVGVARALAARPAVLLMDEPFGALDPLNRQALQQVLADIQRALGSTIVLVTHDIDEALRLGQHLVLLDQGRILQAGTPAQLLLQPANAQVSDFLGRATLGQRLLGLRRVAEILRPGEAADGLALQPEQSLQDALVAFLAAGVHRLPVADAQGRALGAVHFVDLLPAQR